MKQVLMVFLISVMCVACASKIPPVLFKEHIQKSDVATVFLENYHIDSNKNENFIFITHISRGGKTIRLNKPGQSVFGNTVSNTQYSDNVYSFIPAGKYKFIVEIRSVKGTLGAGVTYVTKEEYEIDIMPNSTYIPSISAVKNSYAVSAIARVKNPYDVSCGKYFSEKSADAFDEEETYRKDCEEVSKEKILSHYVLDRSIAYSPVVLPFSGRVSNSIEW